MAALPACTICVSGAWGDYKKISDPLELELQAVVLKIKPRPSGRVDSALNP